MSHGSTHLFKCRSCGAERVYGFGTVIRDTLESTPFIRCAKGGGDVEQTVHDYSRQVTADWIEYRQGDL